jgi:hypothetical protein
MENSKEKLKSSSLLTRDSEPATVGQLINDMRRIFNDLPMSEKH